MKKVISALFLLITLLFPSTVSAQVVINEFSSGSSSNDWVEIYNSNTATQSADLSLYRLKDMANNQLDLLGIIAPGEFKAFGWMRWLNKDGDIFSLVRISDNYILDEVIYGDQGGICAPSETQSIGRSPDGTGGFIRFSTPTQGSTNNSTEDPCPTSIPTEAPTDTPTPTQTPTTTPTVRITKTPTPTIEAEEVEENEELILGLRDELSPTPEPENEKETNSKKEFPALAGIFMVAGFGFIGLAGYPFLKKRKKGYNLFSGRKRKHQTDSSKGV